MSPCEFRRKATSKNLNEETKRFERVIEDFDSLVLSCIFSELGVVSFAVGSRPGRCPRSLLARAPRRAGAIIGTWRLPAPIGGALPGVHVVRNLADVEAMAPQFNKGAKVLIGDGAVSGAILSDGAETGGRRNSDRLLR